MAPIPKQISLKLTIDGIEQFKTTLSVAANKINRIQHLFKEVNEILVDLENDANNISVAMIDEEGVNKNVREQEGMGGKEEATGKEAGGVRGTSEQQHSQTKAGESNS